ncbi:MAG: hypothetical protein HN392_05915 [Anaerolineae bacterium]|jgi:membrane-bound serine protease (ClpP class)|nr:hypothetical protein [Anaerolineae bacterium]MBT7074065.1 hypothetical protein [Anaerolineae bacterium]MBT7782782.1 hypothetical protein [Anaerolineae bacterium]
MDMILLDPNIAYLILVGGVLLTFFALATPGTGFLEIGALFLLLFAGYAAYNLGSNTWALILLVLSIIPFVMSIRDAARRKLYLGLSIFAVIIGSAYLFRGDGWLPSVSLWLAILVSLLSGGFLWFIIIKTLEALDVLPSHSLEALIGRVGEAKTNIHAEGSAQISGELWTVRSVKPIKARAQVRVIERKGFVLDVEEI